MQPTRIIVIGQHFAYPHQLNLNPVGDDEIFKEVIFFDGNILPWYYISNYGRVYSCRYKRILSAYSDERNYQRVTIVIDEQGKTCFTGVHKLELMSFYPILEAKNNIYIPNHKDGNTSNNYLSNLEWMTVSQNTRHALDTGLAKCKCNDNSRSYLPNFLIHKICEMLQQGKSTSYILNILGYSYGNERNKIGAIIRLIKRGQTYLDISSQYDIPGIKGQTVYEPEVTKQLCELLSDGNTYRIDEVCDIFNISLENRKMFRNFIDDILKGNTHTYITRNYINLKRPVNVPRSHKYYDYYN